MQCIRIAHLRERKHIRTLIELAESGNKAGIVFVAGVPGVRAFKPNRDADAVIADLLSEASNLVLKAIQLSYRKGYVFLENPDLPVEV
jgi:sugar fermentation stimulation protein A